MNEQNQETVMGSLLKRGYSKVFFENWPTMTGGILIGIMSIVTFAWARPWGVAGGLRNWGDWFFHAIGIYEKGPISPFISTSSLLTLGLLWGAFGSSLMAKQFSIRTAPGLELIKGLVGGTLMGIGAAMAGGCNVGGFYSSVSALSLGGILMMLGLIVGAYIGLKYLFWELEHFPPKTTTTDIKEGEKKGFDWLSIEPYIGVIVFLGAIVMFWLYAREAYTREGGLLLCGIAFGVIIQRTRFCFVRAFRDPFMTGEGELARAVAVSVIISVLGFTVLKWNGVRPEYIYVTQTVWFGSFVGGIVFGIGMVIAGGCGSGSVWRAGEGQVKLMLAVITFALSISLFKALIKSSPAFKRLIGKGLFIPQYIGYKWTLILIVLFFGLYYLIATWNEETDKFTMEI